MPDNPQNIPGNAPPAPGGNPAPSRGKNIAMAIVAYVIFFIPLLTGDAQKDPFVKYHVKQGLVLFLLAVLVGIVNGIMPSYFWYAINWILSLALLVLFVVGIINAANGKQQPLPVVGKFADVFRF